MLELSKYSYYNPAVPLMMTNLVNLSVVKIGVMTCVFIQKMRKHDHFDFLDANIYLMDKPFFTI